MKNFFKLKTRIVVLLCASISIVAGLIHAEEFDLNALYTNNKDQDYILTGKEGIAIIGPDGEVDYIIPGESKLVFKNMALYTDDSPPIFIDSRQIEFLHNSKYNDPSTDGYDLWSMMVTLYLLIK